MFTVLQEDSALFLVTVKFVVNQPNTGREKEREEREREEGRTRGWWR